MVVATFNEDGTANAMTAVWGGICCTQPPCLAVSLRKETLTYANILQRRAFTVSLPSEDSLKEVDYLGLVSGREVDKLAAAKLSAFDSEVVDAPYVTEFPVVFECKLAHVLELGLHTQFVGEIIDVKAERGVLDHEGLLDTKRLRPLVFLPDRQAYYGIGSYLGQGFSSGAAL